MDVASYIAGELSRRGVRFVFGVPGGPSIPYIEAWRHHGIEFILTSHEGAAGVMADVTGRLSGIPGVCHATFGPGATNMSTGVGSAYLDRSPVIAFTTELSDSMMGRTTQMGIDHQGLFRPLTKRSFRLSPENAPGVMEEAFAIACAELPGPVHIGLPADIAGREVAAGSYKPPEVSVSTGTAPRSEVLKMLREARRPVIAAGLTAVRKGIGTMLGQFLAASPMPVVLTPMARDLIPADHPCYAGVLFHALSDRLVKITGDADLVIGTGYDPVEYNYESWLSPGTKLLHFGTVPVDMPPQLQVHTVTGEPADWFTLLEEARPGGYQGCEKIIGEVRSRIRDVFAERVSAWGPVAALAILRELIPETAILTCDVGSHLHLAGQYWKTGEKGRMIITNGWSAMGFGIPSALAAALNDRNRTVVAVTGDGGFLMTAGEMMTARRYDLNIKVMVISDRELNLIRVKKAWKGLDPYGTTLVSGDLFGSNHFLGLPVYSAHDMTSATKAVTAALASHGPTIVNAVVDGSDYEKLVVRQ